MKRQQIVLVAVMALTPLMTATRSLAGPGQHSAAVEVQADIHERAGGVWQAILAAASSDEEVARWREELEAGRKLETHRALAMIYEREIDPHVVDVVWALFSAEVYALLTRDSGWSRADYEAWVFNATERVVG